MSLRVRVCSTADVPEGRVAAFAVEGVAVPVLIANVDGRYLATTSMCPHDTVSLLGGTREGTRITCPGHGYQFDLATGRCTRGPAFTLQRYRVTIDGEDLYVDLI